MTLTAVLYEDGFHKIMIFINLESVDGRRSEKGPLAISKKKLGKIICGRDDLLQQFHEFTK